MTSLGGKIAAIIRHNSPTVRRRGNVLRVFVKKIGLIYFGTVDQKDDEHELIRGLTVSTTHRDSHYAVGSFDEYDISLVDRFDIIVNPHGGEQHHNWLIFRIDLRAMKQQPPHIFLRPVGHSLNAYDKFYTAFSTLQPQNAVFDPAHSHEFHRRYELFAASTHLNEVEALFPPEVTAAIAARMWPHAVEIDDGALFIYITETKLTQALLEATLGSGMWLASVLLGTQDED